MRKLKAHIYIPSKGRPDSKLVDLLLSQDGLEDFTVVVEPQDLEKYQAVHPEISYLILPENDHGIAYVRNYIKEYCTKYGHTWYWMLDDDISNFYKTIDNKNIKTTYDEALGGAESLFFERYDLGQVALEYQQFAWSTNKAFTLNSYCDVCVCINTKNSYHAKYRPEVNLKEDRDFTLQILSSGYLTMRVQKYSFSAPKNGSNKGGLADIYAQHGREKAASEKMIELWGNEICQLNIKKDGRPDCKINWAFFRKHIV